MPAISSAHALSKIDQAELHECQVVCVATGHQTDEQQRSQGSQSCR
jgi:hypothetical protein